MNPFVERKGHDGVFIHTDLHRGDPDDDSRYLVVEMDRGGLLTIDRKGYRSMFEDSSK